MSDESGTSFGEKRKADTDINDAKRPKIDEHSKSDKNKAMSIEENVDDSTARTNNDQIVEPPTDSTDNVSKPQTSKRAKRLAEKSVEHGTEMDTNLVPQSKYYLTLDSLTKYMFIKSMGVINKLIYHYRNTFPLKMAPWIRVNGSVNRRVLDKYAGTILLYCIENVGLTLFTLCTRFHYLLPIHVHELVQVCKIKHVRARVEI